MTELNLNINTLNQCTDEELMTTYQLADGVLNVAAFDILFKRWKDRLWSYVAKKVKSAEEREDLIQKIFLKLHHARGQYQKQYLFAQWIFTIAKTTVIDHARKNKRTSAQEVEFNEEIAPVITETVTNSLDLSSLSQEQQKIIQMRFEEDLEFSEIAMQINKSETSIRKILSRAYAKIRDSKIVRGAP